MIKNVKEQTVENLKIQFEKKISSKEALDNR